MSHLLVGTSDIGLTTDCIINARHAVVAMESEHGSVRACIPNAYRAALTCAPYIMSLKTDDRFASALAESV